MFATDDVEQFPRTVRHHHAMDLGVVLHDFQHFIERIVGRPLGDLREDLFRLVAILAEYCCVQSVRGTSRCDNGMQDFRLVSAMLLDAVTVAVEYLEYRQRALLGREFSRHLIRGRQGHHRMEADVVLTAERPCIGESRRRHDLLQRCPRLPFLDNLREQLLGGGVLHEPDERLAITKRQVVRRIIRRPSGTQPHVTRGAVTDPGHQHASPHIRQKITSRRRACWCRHAGPRWQEIG